LLVHIGMSDRSSVLPEVLEPLGTELRVSDGVLNVSVAEVVLAGSATLVAVTVTICWMLMQFGAVYNPFAEIVPAPAGARDHVTVVSLAFVTLAVNCCVCEAVSAAV